MPVNFKRLHADWIAACAVPILYLVLYTPYGMDTTDFGYFYGYAWRIIEGQTPYRDFFYIKPALPLYWHAFWMALTPEQWQVLGGKAGFLATMLASAWFGALYLNRSFNFSRLCLTTPILATTGFVFGVHSFPHMPWHTADGVLFSSAALYAAVSAWPLISGIFAACAMCCKQSFALVPLAILILIIIRGLPGRWRFIMGWLGCLAVALIWIYSQDAWANFRTMTTGQLDIREAIDAGILIYLRQNWLLPALALIPWLLAKLLKWKLPRWLLPGYCYLAALAVWYLWTVHAEKTWIGFGASWPTLFMLLGALCVLWPGRMLAQWGNPPAASWPRLANAAALAAALLASWSVAISGGYKIPAMFATPLIFSFVLIHADMGGDARKLCWASLCAGLLIFGAGYKYPYVFPVRPLEKSQLIHDAGSVFRQATGVYVDRDMLERLAELKQLRAKYGPNYKTLPGFSMAYYLNGDKPVFPSDWLIDWEINGEVDKLYRELVDRNLTVFMERDQLGAEKADAYDRAGYGVPRLVRQNWRIVDETPHFVIFQAPREDGTAK